jgi:hypothetical protein
MYLNVCAYWTHTATQCYQGTCDMSCPGASAVTMMCQPMCKAMQAHVPCTDGICLGWSSDELFVPPAGWVCLIWFSYKLAG